MSLVLPRPMSLPLLVLLAQLLVLTVVAPAPETSKAQQLLSCYGVSPSALPLSFENYMKGYASR